MKVSLIDQFRLMGYLNLGDVEFVFSRKFTFETFVQDFYSFTRIGIVVQFMSFDVKFSNLFVELFFRVVENCIFVSIAVKRIGQFNELMTNRGFCDIGYSFFSDFLFLLFFLFCCCCLLISLIGCV